MKHRLAGVPRAVWGLSATFVLLLGTWALLTPTTEAPDEASHADVIFHLAAGGSYPAWDKRSISKAILNTSLTRRPGATAPALLAKNAPRRDRRADFAAAGGDAPSVFPNQIPQHPPLYYEAGSVALRVQRHVLGAHRSVDDELQFLRLLNILIVAPLCLLCWATARRLGGAPTVAVAAAAVPLAIPELLHVGAATNNDNLLMTFSALLALLLAGVIRGDTRRTTALGIGVVTGLAILTKGFALLFPIWIAAAYAVPVLRDRTRSRAGALGFAISLAGAAVVGGWWWLRHLIQEGSLAPSIADRSYLNTPRPAGFTPHVPEFGWKFVRRMAESFWDDFGYFSAHMTGGLLIAITLVTVALVVLAFRPPGGRSGPRRGDLIALGSVFLVLATLVAVRGYQFHTHTGKLWFVYGRYLFAAVVPFSAIVAVGLDRVARGWAPVAVIAAAMVMQLDGMYSALTQWWGAPDASLGESIDAVVAWLPSPPIVVWVVLVALVAVTAATIWELVRVARHGMAAPPERVA